MILLKYNKMDKKEIARAYYKIYYQNHRQKQIDAATQWYLASDEHKMKHAIACQKHLAKNKKVIYTKRRVKYYFKILMKELSLAYQKSYPFRNS